LKKKNYLTNERKRDEDEKPWESACKGREVGLMKPKKKEKIK